MKWFLRIHVGLFLFLPLTLSAQFAFYDSLNGIYWSQIEPPSFENLKQCQIVRPGLGYVLGESGTLYEFVAGRAQPWRRLPRPEPYTIDFFYALAPDNIWAAVNVPQLYKRVLFHWDGKTWASAAAPNVYNIRHFLFTADGEGWLACDYGEVWHYERGHWLQEALPLFIHANYLALTPDSALYVVCEAPDQVAVLQRKLGKWEWFDLQIFHQPAQIALSPAGHLTWASTDYSFQRIEAFNRPIWLLPFQKIEFLSNGFGYGFSNRTIYALHDTAYHKIAEAPTTINDLALMDKNFSWLVGYYGFMLAPQRQPALFRASEERFFAMREHSLSKTYGMAVLQERPGLFSRLYFVQTGAPNVAYEAAPFENRFMPDQAPRWNLAGPAIYEEVKISDGAKATNYDLAAATGDLNGDGRDDMIVTSMYGHPFVYFNSGHDYYFDATEYTGLRQWGSVRQRPMFVNLFDADHDGDLDLFIACQYQSNAFFINNGRGKFAEVTMAAGLSTNGGGIGGYVADFDGDGWDELYVTCVNRPNLFYRNLGPDSLTGLPRFADASIASGAACWPALKQSQGAAIGDYDNDGDFDLFVCNLAGDNRLLQNDGKGFFLDATAAAGLADSAQSVGAVFFDADNDGDLDLMVANKGFERFYKNQDAGRFIDGSEYLGLKNANGDAMINNSRQFGGNSSGVLAVDFDDDEDLDILVSNYDVGLTVFENNLNVRRSAIQIFPEGVAGNRSAVGVKVYLYASGQFNNPAGLVGMRVIEAANSYGCSPAKVAHFGVDATKTYEAKIIFSGGTIRRVQGLRGGDRRVVLELDGAAEQLIKTKRALANLLLGYRSRERVAVVLLGAFLLAIMLAVGKKLLGLARDELKLAAALFNGSLFACLMLWFAPSTAEFIARPLAVSFGVTLAALMILHNRHLYQTRPASIEMLQMRLKAFGHGEFIHNLMNRLDFYAENFAGDVDLPVAARQQLIEVANDLQLFLNNEIGVILAHQYGNNFAVDAAHRLHAVWNKLKKALPQLCRRLARQEALDKHQFMAVAGLQRQLREQAQEIQRRLGAECHCDLAPLIAEQLRRRHSQHAHFAAMPDLPAALIAPADLLAVIEELLQNALRQMKTTTMQIDITLQKVFDELHLDVRDNGAGIPENLWEEIFQRGFTTKPNGNGGFGLYNARRRLEKYGGKIFVAASEIGQGTTMRICLKTALV